VKFKSVGSRVGWWLIWNAYWETILPPFELLVFDEVVVLLLLVVVVVVLRQRIGVTRPGGRLVIGVTKSPINCWVVSWKQF